VLIWDGALWHGGGANRTKARRTGVAMNYCAGFIRQQENSSLASRQTWCATSKPRLQALVGYGVYRGLIGHIDKKSPLSSSPAAARSARSGTAAEAAQGSDRAAHTHRIRR